MKRYDAVVVGSGPNGLAAAITIARAGRSVLVLEGEATCGGGARSKELTLPGFVHDVCSAVQPLAAASPFFRRLPLREHGLEWVQPDVMLAHPLDNGDAGVLYRSLDEMLARYPGDAKRYAGMFGPLVENWNALLRETLQPITHIPRSPFLLARFGLTALQPADRVGRSFGDPALRALFAGCAGHSIVPLNRWMTASFAMVLMAAGHAAGWPFVRGGSQRLTDALVSYLRTLGGEIEISRPVRSLEDLPPHRVALFDVAPVNLLRICGSKMAGRYRDQILGFRRGPGVFKVDYALSAPVPWKSPECARAGTLHLGGTLEEVVEAEHEVGAGRVPERPLVLAAQPSVFDPSRAPEGKHTLWAYAHVPPGNEADMAERIEAQVERFAPGFRDIVLRRSELPPRALQEHNPNLVGGDITGGSNGGLQLFFRPRKTLWPYDTPVDGVYLCSASTPPGGGVHGMCGYWAARRALKRELR
jgi:phytoene dehydrogenase-like protein